MNFFARPPRAKALCVCGVLLLADACVSEDQDTNPAAQWLGPDTHLQIFGVVEGESLDIGEGGRFEVVELSCKREYLAPLVGDVPDETQAVFHELKIYATVDEGSGPRYLTLELKRHDLQSDPIGTSVDIVPRLETMDPDPNQMWFEWEWNDELGGELVETAAQDGEFVLELFTGEPGAGGVVIPTGEGSVGGHVHARWSQTDEVDISFSLPCLESEIETEA